MPRCRHRWAGLLVALFTAPVAAGQGTEPKKEDPEAVVRKLGALATRLETAIDTFDMTAAGMKAQLGELRRQLTEMREEFDALKVRMGDRDAKPRRALRPARGDRPTRVLFVNDTSGDVTARVNGILYTVPAGAFRYVPVTAGESTYRLLPWEDETRTLTVRRGQTRLVQIYE